MMTTAEGKRVYTHWDVLPEDQIPDDFVRVFSISIPRDMSLERYVNDVGAYLKDILMNRIRGSVPEYGLPRYDKDGEEHEDYDSSDDHEAAYYCGVDDRDFIQMDQDERVKNNQEPGFRGGLYVNINSQSIRIDIDVSDFYFKSANKHEPADDDNFWKGWAVRLLDSWDTPDGDYKDFKSIYIV